MGIYRFVVRMDVAMDTEWISEACDVDIRGICCGFRGNVLGFLGHMLWIIRAYGKDNIVVIL